ncbi:4-diphosphocytidyl-2-C-methyl-D-erythritol kinase [uncultured Roseburia sp.]|uniref:4-diphosphocytidyl-2-C-methyl-D-erythritol kinase n=1 Tax=Brotonthovivens ammoniilytica TaxID=2981725 RepID=A0ABT2TLZ7_9FIRM|nr:4-(cytidine 5'-diphospho)-2-C-methyl-D-erythritol kinase [Brotonthovivens ammoniilytica]MCU6763107.1 4-(cytidine 5'-diphospho)-2-C-methyl-D-erythritol kinase [Brotonthovivens ammoniilytica]SCJ03400.1 4-diphosphocytidyl-2-C-methyl-D-erythritol kinase [uncultured Roseburia sp.]
MDDISLKALAKINLGLDVTGKREDGYHEVRMIMQTIHLYDRVEIKKTKSPAIRVETNLYYLPVNEDNLVYRAAKLMKDEFKIKEGVRIVLQKFIPVAAGLAGGSSDAAAVLVGMNRIFQLGLKQDRLMEIGLKLGADVPFCIMRGTALAEGIGEVLSPLPPMPKCPVLIAKPGVSVSTKFVYENLRINEYTKHPDIDKIAEAIKKKNLKDVASGMGNILETVTIPKYPVIDEIKSMMIENGALNAMMSGSGPTVFGLFQGEKDVRRAYDALKQSGLTRNLYTSDIHNNRR